MVSEHQRAPSKFDLIVVGSGAAGCAAALGGVQCGLSVALLEKAGRLGGGSAGSLGTLWIADNPLARAAGMDDDIAEALEYARFVAAGAGIDANIETYVCEGGRVVQALLDAGVRLRLAAGLPDIFFPAAPGSRPDGRRMIEAEAIERTALGPWCDAIDVGIHNLPGVSWGESVQWGGFGNIQDWDHVELAARAQRGLLAAGSGLIGQFIAVLAAHDVTIRTNTPIGSLIVEGGRVVGVRCAQGGEPLYARRGVILATGGYEGNADLVGRFEGLPDWMNPFSPSNEGDGLVMATEIGAAIHRIPVNNNLFVGCAVPVEDSRDGPQNLFYSVGLRGLPFPGAIAANLQGQRFCDESNFQSVVMAFQKFDPTARRHPNLPAFMIFDDAYRARYPIAGTAPGSSAPDWVVRAPTIEALAAKLGIGPGPLAATVAAFNDDARNGEDFAFGRGCSAFSRSTAGDPTRRNPQLAPLDKPPFYGIRLKMGGICSAGLLTDTKSAVLHIRGRRIPGLYACGNAAAPTDMGVGYQGGTSIGSGIVFGFLAAEHAAARANAH